jgi:hypothetical protein
MSPGVYKKKKNSTEKVALDFTNPIFYVKQIKWHILSKAESFMLLALARLLL